MFRITSLWGYKMKVLVTGASGFLGSHILRENPEFLGIDIKSDVARVFVGDIKDENLLAKLIRENEITRIVHLAGVQYSTYVPPRKRESYFSENVKMAEALKNVALKTNIEQIIYVSTDMVYGSEIKSPVVESCLPKPIGEYGKSKLEAENILLSAHNLKVIVIRPRLILGFGRVGTIKKLARLIASPIPVILIGNGRNRYQFIAASDLSNAILKFLNSNLTGIFNIGSQNPPNLNELFSKVFRALGKKKSMVHVPASIAISLLNILDTLSISPLAPEQFRIAALDYELDTSKIEYTISWKPEFSDDQILTLTLKNLL